MDEWQGARCHQSPSSVSEERGREINKIRMTEEQNLRITVWYIYILVTPIMRSNK